MPCEDTTNRLLQSVHIGLAGYLLFEEALPLPKKGQLTCGTVYFRSAQHSQTGPRDRIKHSLVAQHERRPTVNRWQYAARGQAPSQRSRSFPLFVSPKEKSVHFSIGISYTKTGRAICPIADRRTHTLFISSHPDIQIAGFRNLSAL